MSPASGVPATTDAAGSGESSRQPRDTGLRPRPQETKGSLHAVTAGLQDASWFRANWLNRAFASMPAHVAVINAAGEIMLINSAWKAFAAGNDGEPSCRVSTGANYLEVCRKSSQSEPEAERALLGIEQVLDGTIDEFTMEYPCHGPDHRRWFLMSVSPLEDGGASGAVISHQDITPVKLAEEALRVSDARLSLIFDNTPVGIAELSADGHWVHFNEALCTITGYDAEELRQQSFLDLTHPADRDADAANIEIMRAGGKDAFRLEKRCLRKDGSERWINSSLSCLRHADGGIERFIATLADISANKLIENRQQMLLNEFAHRGKNLLAVIESIASLSFSGNHGLDDECEAFTGRLEALSRTYGTLASENFEGSMLDAIFRNELGAFGAQAIIDGPSITLSIKAAQTLALIAHELATNATKHGALSVPSGSLRVSWTVSGSAGDRRLRLDWREEGGPPITSPPGSGFGSTLLGEIAGMEFDCIPELAYEADGFRYRLDAPLSRLGSVLVDSPVRRKLKSAVTMSFFDTWTRQRSAGARLPQLDGFDWTRFADTGALTIAAIEHGGDSVRFVQVGHALVERLGHALGDELAELDDAEKLKDVYLRCARKGEPTHEYMRFDFGDGEPLSFERLLLPFSATAGTTVTHVAGVAIFDGHTLPLKGDASHEQRN